MNLDHNHNDTAAFLKLLVAWCGALLGSITLQQVVWTLTGIYTALQIYVLVRDKLRRHRK